MNLLRTNVTRVIIISFALLYLFSCGQDHSDHKEEANQANTQSLESIETGELIIEESTGDEPAPCICTKIFAPVCVDGTQQFGNSCEAECAGHLDYDDGECP